MDQADEAEGPLPIKVSDSIPMRHNKLSGAVLSQLFVILTTIFFAPNPVAAAQARTSELDRTTPSVEFQDSLLTPLKPQVLEAPYRPITLRQSLRWFITSTISPSHLVGEIFVSAGGTAFDRPAESGPHWGGLADRFEVGMAGRVAGNAIEASAGLILREDPHYFRVPDRSFKARVANVVRLTFAARGGDGSFGPAYARHLAIFGSNYLSNRWRVHSEANAPHALLRSSEGLAGRMAANAFQEFWPDVKKRVFHKRN